MDNTEEMQAIQERNRRVELDKAWETSWTRRLIIAAMTYIIALLFLFKIDAAKPFLSALVPTGGYLLSTLSLGIVKEWWIKKYERN